MAALREQEGIAARAVEFVVLTCTRIGEALGATWGEIDFRERVWTVPSSRMKGGKPHKVPLADRAFAILEALGGPESDKDTLIFPGARYGKPLGSATLSNVLKRLGHAEITTHGFRSSFRDWAAECTNSPDAVCELALAHTVSDKVLAAYKRTDLIARRRSLAEAWARYCEGADNIVELRKGAW